jgi:hypothetical protein
LEGLSLDWSKMLKLPDEIWSEILWILQLSKKHPLNLAKIIFLHLAGKSDGARWFVDK